MERMMMAVLMLQVYSQYVLPVVGLCCGLVVVGWWGVLRKAGLPGWLSLIPPVNAGAISRVAWGKLRAFWFFLAFGVAGYVLFYPLGMASRAENLSIRFLCMGVGLVLLLAAFAVDCATQVRLARRFRKGGLFALGLILLRPVFALILGFGGSQYQKRASRRR